VRESADECVLIVATRSATEVLLGEELPDGAVLLDGAVSWSGGRISTGGPTFAAWQLPGTELPGW
jgi:hypothetical protein